MAYFGQPSPSSGEGQASSTGGGGLMSLLGGGGGLLGERGLGLFSFRFWLVAFTVLLGESEYERSGECLE